MNVAQTQSPIFYPFLPPNLEERIAKYYSTSDEEGPSTSSNRNIAQALAQLTSTEPRPFFVPSPNDPVKESPMEVWDSADAYNPTLVLSRGKEHVSVATSEAKACLNNMDTTDRFFRKIFNRNPVNSSTKIMRSYINSPFLTQAGWCPTKGTVFFGIPDKRVFNRFELYQDTVVHEFGHAVTQYTANFEYLHQSGAINESISDVFAIMCKHAVNEHAYYEGSWTLCDDIIVRDDPENGTSLRSMSHPGQAYVNHPAIGSDQQVKHMNEYLKLPKEVDRGGVHFNSGIPNHAFYLAASGIGGCSWDKPGNIWYNALLNGKKEDDFSTFAFRTLAAAKELEYHEGVYNEVAKAWTSVGVDLRENKTTSIRDVGEIVGLSLGGGFLLTATLVGMFEMFKKATS